MISENFKTFHYLVEIAIGLNNALDANTKMSTIKHKKEVSLWRNRLQRWIDTNYKENGVDKVMENLFFGVEM